MANKKKIEKSQNETDIEREKTCTCDCDNDCGCGCQDGEECTCGGESNNCDCEENQNENDNKDYLDMARRIQAEFDNYRKRTNDEVEKAYQTGIAVAVVKFLPALDVLPKAIAMTPEVKTKEGMEMFVKELNNSLTSIGVERIETKGKPFDATVANAVVTIDNSDLEDGVVAEELQVGYKLKNKVIRYAQVVVNRNNK